LRRSQVVAGSGPGALLDLPRHAVIVSGLDAWGDPFIRRFPRIDDERSRARLAAFFEVEGLQLFSPPVEGDTFGATLAGGLVAYQFPQWFIAQRDLAGVRPLVHVSALTNGQWLDDERKKHKVVPLRFLRGCKHGHVEDIDWKAFAHRGQTSCMRQLLWQERGSSGDFVDIFVGCECGQFPVRSLIDATKRINNTPVLGWCRGRSPWLGLDAREECRTDPDGPVESRLLVRNASNAYFSLVHRALSVPEPDQALRTAVGRVIGDLTAVKKLEHLEYERGKPHIAAALGTFTNEQVLAELARRKDTKNVDPRSTKLAELETFLAVKGQEGEDTTESIFYAREQPLPTPVPRVLSSLSKLVKLERLREVTVQVGFTRFEAPSSDIDGELDLEVRSGKLARELKWLPAVENRGEGLFFSFNRKALSDWADLPKVKTRRDQLDAGFRAWASSRKSKKTPPPIEYVMLHTLSHLLMTQLSLSCGYSASSIRERIYVHEKGAGILLHTGTPDAEGTLGGLVNAARDVEMLFREALALAEFCSNDPVCAQHRPDEVHEERFLHGAACHGCLLLSETSCEMRNDSSTARS
jgi:hypothetical protein